MVAWYSFSDTIQVKNKEELSIVGIPETIIPDECHRVSRLKENIVEEARENFK